MMTDPNPYQGSLWRRSVSESDMDLMITTTLQNDSRRLIPTGDLNLNQIYLVWNPVLIAIGQP